MGRLCILFLGLLLAWASSAAADRLLMVEGSELRAVAQLDPDAEVLFEGTDFAVLATAVEDDGASGVEVLDPDYSANTRIVAAYPTDEEARARLHTLGDVLLQRGDVWLIRLADAVPETFSLQGILGVIPLKPRPLSSMSLPLEDAERPSREGREGTWQWVVDEVSETSYKSIIQTLEDFVTRNARTNEYYDACVWAKNTFGSYGLQAEIQEFWADVWWGADHICWNVVAEQPGLDDPELIYIVCGHLDSTAGDPTYPEPIAPGADDNASGSGGVIEAARVLSQHTFAYTIRYICFGAEESGLCGSYVYAENAAQQGEQILGVINMDMLLYDPDFDQRVRVNYDGQSDWLAEAFDTACADYVPDLNVWTDYNPEAAYSDHYPFWVNGFPALQVIEDDLQGHPYYHTTQDLLAHYEAYWPFATLCLKGAVATLVELALYTFVDAVDADPIASQSTLTLSLTGSNPVRDRIAFVLAQPTPGPVGISMTDIQGRTVWSSSTLFPPGGIEFGVPVDHLAAGTYWVRAKTTRASVATRVVVVR